MKKNIMNKLVLYGLSAITSINISGCAKKVDCEIDANHVHLYVSNNGFLKYSSLELDYLPGEYHRTNEIVYVNRDSLEYYDYLNKNDFLHLETNYDLFKKYFPKVPDYTEYEYTYRELISSREIKDEDGNVVDIDEKYNIMFGWTSIPNNQQLTGNQRTITYAYRGYRILYDENRRVFYYELSGYYNSIDELLYAGYTHVKINTFARQVDKNDVIIFKNMVLNK